MKKYSFIALILASLLFSGSSLFAQKGVAKLNLEWNAGLPLGNFKSNYISNGSLRGFTGDVTVGLNNQWALGLGFGTQDFYQKYPMATYDLAPNQQVSAVVTNSIQIMPLLFKAMYTPFQGSTRLIQPYVTAGAGIAFVNYNQYLGEFSSNNTPKGQLSAMADGGIMIPFNKYNSNTAFQLGASFQYVHFNQPDAMALNTVNIHAGFIFRLR